MGRQSLMKENSEAQRKLSSLVFPFMCNNTYLGILTGDTLSHQTQLLTQESRETSCSTSHPPSGAMKNVCAMFWFLPCEPCFPGSLRRQQLALFSAPTKALPHNTGLIHFYRVGAQCGLLAD